MLNYLVSQWIEHLLLELSPSIHWRHQVLEEASWQVKPQRHRGCVASPPWSLCYAWDATKIVPNVSHDVIKNPEIDLPFPTSEFVEARKLILDEFGRELDEDGQVVPMKPQARELVLLPILTLLYVSSIRLTCVFFFFNRLIDTC